MAKVLASRAPSDQALQERLERAAARFSSIHERWSTIARAPAGEAAGLERARPGAAEPPSERAAEPPSERATDPSLAESDVCVTPILDVASSDSEEQRPRFKTLMGVPRNDPDLDELAGLRPAPGHERESSAPSAGDAAKRPPPLPEHLLAGSASASASDAEPPTALAATTPSHAALAVPALHPHTSPATHETALSPVPALPLSSLVGHPELGAELGALRRSQRRRSWLVGIGSFVATLAVFAAVAPRERTAALRWLREEAWSLLQPVAHTVTDRANALKPNVVEPASAVPVGREPSGRPTSFGSDAIEAAPSPLTTQRALEAAPQAQPSGGASASTDTPATEVASGPKAEPPSALASDTSSSAPVASAANPRSDLEPNADDSIAPRRAVGSKKAAPSQLAAPRKRSTLAAPSRATTTDSKPRAARSTKERATRQNSPRRGGNGGIIRETPF